MPEAISLKFGMWSAEGGGNLHSKICLVSSRQHRATEVRKLRFLSSCQYTHGVARRLLGPHDTLPCVLICGKANRLLGFLKRNLYNAPIQIKEHLYKQLLLPSMEYCSAIWDPYHQTTVSKLEMIQHRAARFVLNKPWHRSSQQRSIRDMLNYLQWPKFKK